MKQWDDWNVSTKHGFDVASIKMLFLTYNLIFWTFRHCNSIRNKLLLTYTSIIQFYSNSLTMITPQINLMYCMFSWSDYFMRLISVYLHDGILLFILNIFFYLYCIIHLLVKLLREKVYFHTDIDKNKQMYLRFIIFKNYIICLYYTSYISQHDFYRQKYSKALS